jgi:hypothetical protein
MGTDVGKLAQRLFPGGVEVDIWKFGNLQNAVLHTEKLIAEGACAIYEAAFQFNNVLVLVDILVRGDAGWKIYEVKSSTGMKPYFKLDAAVQYYVVSNAGLRVEDIGLVHINNQYVRSGELDIDVMFKVEPVLDPVLESQDAIAVSIEELKQVLQLPGIPDIEIGEYCTDPYECDFTGHCWQHVPENSVFELTRLGKSKQFELYRSGTLTLDQVPDDYPLNESQRLQVDCFKSQTAHADRESIQHFLQELHYPLCFLDFETHAPAIPMYDNSRPYQHIPFQYSLHVRENEQAELKHYEYFGMPPADPRAGFIDKLLEELDEEGDIIVYNQSFEIQILKDLIRDFPVYEDRINGVIGRIKDLMILFQKHHFYTPEMHGSHSIKAVLPVLVPDLDYSDLTIAGGGSAMIAYERLIGETNDGFINETKQNLLEYCRRDTLAMVKILDVLQSL